MIDMTNPVAMAQEIATLRQQRDELVQALTLCSFELSASYHGIDTLPDDHSAKGAYQLAHSTLKKVRNA